MPGKKKVKIADITEKRGLAEKEMEKVKGGAMSSPTIKVGNLAPSASCTCAGSARSDRMSAVEDNS